VTAPLVLFDPLAAGYEAWFETKLGAFVAERERDLLLRLLRASPRERVLEIGSGTGFFLREIARTGAYCVGLEPSRGMLEVARSHALPAVEYVRGAAEALPFTPASFDAAIFMTALEFVANVDAALREARRVVRPGGRLVFGVLNAAGPWAEARRREGGLWEKARFFSAAELSTFLTPFGDVTIDFCVHAPPSAEAWPTALLRVADRVRRLVNRESGALIGARVQLKEADA